MYNGISINSNLTTTETIHIGLRTYLIWEYVAGLIIDYYKRKINIQSSYVWNVCIQHKLRLSRGYANSH